jgi:hypothetical protein
VVKNSTALHNFTWWDDGKLMLEKYVQGRLARRILAGIGHEAQSECITTKIVEGDHVGSCLRYDAERATMFMIEACIVKGLLFGLDFLIRSWRLGGLVKKRRC